MLKPVIIVHRHYQKEDNMQDLVQACCNAMHWSHGERSLLSYYATVSTGFSPAAKTAKEATGITKRHVYRLRDLLESKGVLTRQGKILYVNWDRIKLFASLDPEMTRSKHATYGTIERREHVRDRKLRQKALFAISAPLGTVISWFAQMDDEEYGAVSSAIARENRVLSSNEVEIKAS